MEEVEKLPYSSLIGALQYQSETRPNKPALLYPDPNEKFTKYASLTYEEYNNITNHLAAQILNSFPSLSSDERITCALLAGGGIEYLLSEYALLKLPNVIIFPISTRNSQSAIEHLLKESQTTFLLTTSQFYPMIKTIQQQQNQFQSLKILLLDNEQFQIKELLKYKDKTISNRIQSNEELNKVIVILHSSGSTAHPKAIRLTNRYFLVSLNLHLSLNKHFWEETDVVLVWGALFHSLAFNTTARAILMGLTFALPLFPTFPPKPDQLFRNIQVNDGITILYSVPTLIEQLVRELLLEKNQQIALKPLQKLKFVMYSGADCPEEISRILVENGIRLISNYGSTETGVILVKNFDSYDKRWKIMQIPPIRIKFLRFENPPNAQNPNEKMFIHLPTDPFLAENISNLPDGCYTTGDIIVEDPPNSGEYFVYGRRDDTLVHINGEKTNSLSMENIIRRSPLVQQVAVIGHKQFCTAALIQLNIEETSHLNSNQIEENIWKSVEQANKDAPSHSRLLRELVYILPMENTLPVTDKGNLQRQKVNQQYSILIKEIYQKFLNGKQEKMKESSWTKESIEKCLIDQLKSMVENLDDSSRSIFDFGVNSLQVLQLKNFISQNICQISEDFLYENSSIDQMTKQLIKDFQPEDIQQEEIDPFHYQLIEQMIDKYIHLIEQNSIETIEQNTKSERVFLITGANGSLANFIIRDLLEQSPSIVKRIYCLLRGTDTKQRLFQSFEQRQLDIHILNKHLEKRLIILSQSMNLTEQYLGLNQQIYKELQNEVTDLIHAAWKMNFNQTIKDFQSDFILGLFHLLKFSSSNQIQFHFLSSVASASSGFLTIVKEEPLPRNPQIPLRQGYGQSKYVAEHLCWAARQLWNVPINIYRIGQISGDIINGVWNTSEMAPMMIYAGAGQFHQMPNIGGDINWIPVNICSSVLVDLALKSSFDISTSPNEHVYHLLNPHSITYDQYLQILRQVGFNFEIVSPEEFVNTVLNSNDLSNPLIKLSSFLKQKFLKNDQINLSKFETIQTVQRSKILRHCPKIDSNLIQLYSNYWKKQINF